MGRARSFQAAAATDPGRERSHNEDRVLCEPELGIFGVIDGVGGESAGEVAAETALEVLRARLSRRTTGAARLVREAIALANRRIYERARADAKLSGMSCVVTVVVLDGAQATVGHVGDSRLYAVTPGEIRKVTPDHSPVGAREDAGDLSEIEAMRHPRRNEIFRDVGSGPHEPDEPSWIDVLELPFDPGGAFLLCSDGLSDMVPSQEILESVESHAASPRAAVRALIERANAAGGKDNVSAVLVAGERFAEAVRRRREGAGARPPGSPPDARRTEQSQRGAAWVRPTTGERLRESMSGALLRWLVVVALLAAALAFFRAPLYRWAEGLLGLGGDDPQDGPAVLVVGIGDGGFATIGEALARARPGQTIAVGPGRYHERLTLRDGVALVARTPRGAVLLPPPGRGGGPAVVAAGVHGASLAGFRVAAEPPASWSAGVRLDGSEVVLDDVEVSGAAGAGIDIRGADRSTVRYCYVHQNAGAGIAVAAQAAPRLLSNLIAGNGMRPAAAAPGAPGIDIRESAAPLVAGNRIEGNGGPGVSLAAPDRAEEIWRWNAFGALPREQAVRLAGAAAAGQAGAAGRPPIAARPPITAARPPAAALPPAAAPARTPRRHP
ncbi:MAG TPA: protein phosphatase 2C domain-containing protein [Thermoanaerobaculia bacterium]|nr:protein phosphatase 2C domain-containing protein [Thermoanaerobaculia bacterium]